MVNKRSLIIAIIYLVSLCNITGVDMDFGVFNYKRSRLSAIKRYGPTPALNQQIKYKYDQDGYLIGRELKSIYTSTISYDLETNIITEEFTRYSGSNKLPPVILQYYYDNNEHLIKYTRQEGTIYNYNDISLSEEIKMEYNEQGDITRIDKSKGFPSQHIFLPDDGFDVDIDSIYKYEYEENKKIIYYYNNDKTYHLYLEQYFNEDKLLTKIIRRFHGNEIVSTNYFYYDKNKNLIKTMFVDNLIENMQSIEKNKYEYDEKNRLKKRIIYLPDDIKKNKIDETEVYIYEDGNYVFYPYLLPPKIKMYLTQQYEMTIDKNVF
jgi:hypothetical protein